MQQKFTLFILVAILSGNNFYGQYIEKIWTDKSDSVYGYYTVIKPLSGRIQGALVLLDGYGGNADNLFAETKIHNIAWANDLLVVGIPIGMRIYADSSIVEYLNKALASVALNFQLQKKKFAIGGFSSGGTIALRYAELCHENPVAFPVLPQAVFDVDSPTDLLGLYQSSQQELKTNSNGWWLGEAQMIIDRFNKELGDAQGDLKKYHAYSPFSKDLNGNGNEKFLKDISVRTYHDVDVNWFIQNRRRSLNETNIPSASEFIRQLVLLGNTKAEFVTATTPGYRSNGSRHPHSWNIVDEINLVQWLKKQLHFFPDNLETAFVYTAPANWSHETILFPFDFATALPYKGFEELRFAPGWGDASSAEKWAYTLLWWLDGVYNFDEKVLQHDLEAYFSGLTRRRAVADKLDMSLWTPAKVQVEKVKTLAGDKASFTASAAIFDAQITKKPATLYFKIHVKDCIDKSKTVVLLEVAGTSTNTPIWIKLDSISTQFRCEN